MWEAVSAPPVVLTGFLEGIVGGYVGTADLLRFLITAGFLAMTAGMFSARSRDCTVDGDPREFNFTARPRSLLRAAILPWNVFPAAFGHRYLPVIIPVLLLPFMYLFAAVTTVAVLICFLPVKGITALVVRSAARRESAEYDRLVGYAVCPVCKQSFPRPDVRCRCGEVFGYPVPGRYGISEHTCVKGHVLHCTSRGGNRSRLDTVCPCCGARILTRESRPVAVSMIGASGSGKTQLMRSAATAIMEDARRRTIATEASPGLEAKGPVLPTPPGEADSEQLFLRSRTLDNRVLVINDISGEEFLPVGDRMLFQEYYRYNDGLIFVIDPLEVIAYHRSGSAFKSDKVTVSGTFETFLQIYATINGHGPAMRSDVPLAVVLTRMDIPHARSAVDAAGTPEAFLAAHGQEEFLKLAEALFSEVVFFKLTATGPNNRAVEPFKWILRKRDPELAGALWPA